MASILLKNVTLNGEKTHVRIDGTRFSHIGETALTVQSDTVIDATDKAILTPFYNTHTHAAMSLLRGYSDDMPLFKWLSEYIWPYEATLTADDIYLGSRLAILEMIKSGTVFFNDMYFKTEQTLRAVDEMGIRANICVVGMNNFGEKYITEEYEKLQNAKKSASLVSFGVAPHAVYTVPKDLFHFCRDFAQKNHLYIHTHVAETQSEYDNCQKEHGCTPIEYMYDLGILSEKTILAHAIYVTDSDMKKIAQTKSVVSHNPISNYKLSSGQFSIKEMLENGCIVTIGTDGDSSNNNLDMREDVKMALLNAKIKYNAETLTVGEIYGMSSRTAAKAFGIDAGEIAVGRLADAILVDLNNERLVPKHHLISNWIYAADSRCIDTVICNGKILMQGGRVDGEEEIISDVKKYMINR